MAHPLVRSHAYDPAIHDASRFDCGNDSLNGWLQDHAPISKAMRCALTFVWCRDGRVVAYYAVAAHAVTRAETPKSISRNTPDPIPALLIGKLAIDRSLRGAGMGGALLLDAFARLTNEEMPAVGRLIVVDAIDAHAHAFYERYGFAPFPNHPMTLYVKAVDAQASVVLAMAAHVGEE